MIPVRSTTSGRRIDPIATRVLFAICLATVGTATARAAAFSTLPSNTWVHESPGFVPSGRGLEARSYSGMAWDEKNGVVIDFGGAHGSYLGNDVDHYDPSVNVWTQMYAPEFPAPGGSGSTSDDPYTALTRGTIPLPSSSQADSPKGRPWSAHTYQAMASNNAGMTLYMDLRYSTWTYQAATATWKRMSPSNAPEAWDSLGHALVYAPDTDEFILVGTNHTGTWSYKYTGSATAPWTRISGTQPSPQLDFAMAADPVNHKIVLFGGEVYASGSPTTLAETWVFDTRTRQWQLKSPKGTIPLSRSAHGMAYDSTNKVVVLFGGRHWNGSDWDCLGDLYVYHVEAETWEQVSQPALRPSPSCLVHGGFVYSPRYNAFFFEEAPRGYQRPGGDQSFETVETWVYRYKVPSSSPTPPLPPQGLRAR